MSASKFRVSSSSFTSDTDFSGSVFFHSDVTVSGTLNVFELKSTLVSSSIIFKSGSTRFGDDANDIHTFTGTGIFSKTVSGSIHHTAGGISYLVGGDNITVASSSNGQVTINATAAQEVFKTIAVSGQDDVVADSATDTLTIAAAGGMTITTTAGSDTVTLSSADTNTQNTTTLSFVDSSDDIILRNTTGGAGSGTDDIKFVAGSNITLTHTDADNITIASSGGGGSEVFKTIAVSGQDDVVADSATDTLTLVAAGGMTITTTAGTDTVTFNSANTNTTYTAGTGINLSGTEFSVDADGATLTTSNADVDHVLVNDGGVFKRITLGNIDISSLNNDSGFTANTGDITGVTAGAGLSGGGSSGAVTLNLDFSELTDMTGDIAGTTEFILQDGTTESRKAASEIKLSAFNNDAGYSTVSSLDDLSDVDLTVSAADTSILVYDSTASAFQRQILSGDASMTREGVVTVLSASSAGKVDTTSVNPTATYYIPFVENSTTTEGDVVHVSSNVTVTQAGSFSAVGVTATGNVNAGAALVHNGDSDTRIAFTTDRVKIEAGGVEFFDFLEGTNDAATFNLAGTDIDLRMLSNNLGGAIHLDSGNDQLVLMGNMDEHVKYREGDGIPSDVNLYVSGTVGSKDSSTKGTTLFAGDVAISGSLYTYGSDRHVHALIALGNDETNIDRDTDFQPRISQVLINQGSGWNTGTYVFTAPHDGLYAVNANVALHSLDSAAGGYKIFLSGSDTSTMIPRQVILDSVSDALFSNDTSTIGTGAGSYMLNGSICIKMGQGDFFSLYVHQIGGTDRQTDILGNSSSNLSNSILNGTHISIVKMS